MKNPREILRDAMWDAGYHCYESLLADKERGQVAAEVLALWDRSCNTEPIFEGDYLNDDGMVGDLVEAMRTHGTANFDAACARFGKFVVMSAIDYVFEAHSRDADDIEDQVRADRDEAAILDRYEQG